MKSQKTLLALFSSTALLLVASFGFNIYQYQRIKGLSEITALEQNAKNKSADDSDPLHVTATEQITKSESVNDLDPSHTGIKISKTYITTENKGERSGVNEIDNLEYQLNAAEEEVDMATLQLAEELTKKDEYKKAIKNLSRSLQSDESLKKANEESARRMADDYDPLFKKLSMSEEEFEEFKDLLVQKNLEMFSASYSPDSSEEEKKEAIEKSRESSAKYQKQIREFLGEEQYETYMSFTMRQQEYRELNDFMKTLPPDSGISETLVDDLIDSMYKGRQAVYAENRSDMTSRSNTQQEMIKRSLNMMKMTNEKYLEASRSVLSPEQVEQFKTYLQKKVDRMESSMKISEYLYGDK